MNFKKILLSLVPPHHPKDGLPPSKLHPYSTRKTSVLQSHRSHSLWQGHYKWRRETEKPCFLHCFLTPQGHHITVTHPREHGSWAGSSAHRGPALGSGACTRTTASSGSRAGGAQGSPARREHPEPTHTGARPAAQGHAGEGWRRGTWRLHKCRWRGREARGKISPTRSRGASLRGRTQRGARARWKPEFAASLQPPGSRLATRSHPAPPPGRAAPTPHADCRASASLTPPPRSWKPFLALSPAAGHRSPIPRPDVPPGWAPSSPALPPLPARTVWQAPLAPLPPASRRTTWDPALSSPPARPGRERCRNAPPSALPAAHAWACPPLSVRPLAAPCGTGGSVGSGGLAGNRR